MQANLQSALRQAEAFAANAYTLALAQGDSLGKTERDTVLKEFSRLTGVSENYLYEHNLRLQVQEYCKELRRKDGLTVGRLDSRFTGMESRPAGDEYQRDLSYSAIKGPYTATFYDYVRRNLGFEFDIPYEIIKDLKKWDMDQAKYTDVSPDLRDAFLVNPDLRVYVACGYFDMATPYFAAQYTFNHLSLPGKLAERIKFSYFEAGHMMYLQLASLERLGKELPAFIAECCQPRH